MSPPLFVPHENIHHVISALRLSNRLSTQEIFRSAPGDSLIMSIDVNPGFWNNPQTMQMGVSILDPTTPATNTHYGPIQTHHFAASLFTRNDMPNGFRYGESTNCDTLAEIITCLHSLIPQDRHFIVIVHNKAGVDPNIIDFIERLPNCSAFVDIYPTMSDRVYVPRSQRFCEIAQATLVPFDLNDMACTGNSSHLLLQAALEIARRVQHNASFFRPPTLDDSIRIRAMWELAMVDTRRPIQNVKPRLDAIDEEEDSLLFFSGPSVGSSKATRANQH